MIVRFPGRSSDRVGGYERGERRLYRTISFGPEPCRKHQFDASSAAQVTDRGLLGVMKAAPEMLQVVFGLEAVATDCYPGSSGKNPG